MNTQSNFTNVLSVDFNIIMYPCIKLYDYHVMSNDNPGDFWNWLIHRFEINNHLSYDADVLHDIAAYMKSVVDNGAKFIPLNYHNEILTFVYTRDEPTPLNVVNIDYCHDIGLTNQDVEHVEYFNTSDSQSWMATLLHDGLIHDYTWVKAPNSDPMNLDIHVDRECNPDDPSPKYREISFRRYFKEINDTHFDRVFFSFSPTLVPYEYHHLYKLICDMINPGGSRV